MTVFVTQSGWMIRILYVLWKWKPHRSRWLFSRIEGTITTTSMTSRKYVKSQFQAVIQTSFTEMKANSLGWESYFIPFVQEMSRHVQAFTWSPMAKPQNYRCVKLNGSSGFLSANWRRLVYMARKNTSRTLNTCGEWYINPLYRTIQFF